MPKTLHGTDAIVALVLEKVELAARRAASDEICNGIENPSTEKFADQIQRILKDMYS